MLGVIKDISRKRHVFLILHFLGNKLLYIFYFHFMNFRQNKTHFNFVKESRTQRVVRAGHGG